MRIFKFLTIKGVRATHNIRKFISLYHEWSIMCWQLLIKTINLTGNNTPGKPGTRVSVFKKTSVHNHEIQKEVHEIDHYIIFVIGTLQTIS